MKALSYGSRRGVKPSATGDNAEIPGSGTTRQYTVFISYRHADNALLGRQWASWLHQSLEAYQIPADLIGTRNARSEIIPPSLYPVFRDEEELQADADLTRHIRTALENSAALVVICSPRAVTSKFVAEEIRYFKELGKSDRLLALIIDGEPNAVERHQLDPAITGDMECLPEPLRYGVINGAGIVDWTQRSEPIAADVRPEQRPVQGWTTAAAYKEQLVREGVSDKSALANQVRAYEQRLELAKLKIIAGAIGVPLGVLTQRDKAMQLEQSRRKARALRRWLMVVAVVAVAAISLGIFAVIKKRDAEVSRQKAVVARNAADDLIRYMQYDLSETLEKLGYLPMMEGINERIRKYHQEHPAEPGNASERLESTAALDQQADLLRAKGDLVGALGKYRASFAIREQVTIANPANLDSQRKLASSYSNIGLVLSDQGNLSGALQQFRAAMKIREKLAKQEPANREFQHTVFVSDCNIGDVLATSGDLAGALTSYREGLAIARKLAAADPKMAQWQRDLSFCYNDIGDTLDAEGDISGALENYRADLAICQKFADQDATDATARQSVAVSYGKIANELRKLGDLPAALANNEKSLAIRTKLAAQDPGNAAWQRDLSLAYSRMGDVLYAKGDIVGALQNYSSDLAISRKLVQKDPANAGWQRDLSVTLLNVGGCRAVQGDFPAAIATYNECRQIREALAARDPNNTDWQDDLGEIHLKIGDVLRQKGDNAAAVEQFRKSLTIRENLAGRDQSNAAWQSNLAEVLERLVTTGIASGQSESTETPRMIARALDILARLEQHHPLTAAEKRTQNSLKQLQDSASKAGIPHS